MTEPLRPLSIGEILDRTFSLYRQNFVLLVSVAILGPLALVFAQLSLAFAGLGNGRAPGMIQNPAAVGWTVIVGMICYLIGHAISVAATTRAVAAVYLGRRISVAEAFASIQGRVPRVIGVMLAAIVVGGLGGGLLIGLGAAVSAALIAAVARIPGSAVKVLSAALGMAVIVAAIVAAIAFAIGYALSVQACVVEDLGVGASLARSKALTKNARKRLMTVMVVCTAIISVLGVIGNLLAFLTPVGTSLLARQIVVQLFALVAGALGAPLLTTALSLVYYDERVRKEGFDLQLLMESVGGTEPANAAEASPTLG